MYFSKSFVPILKNNPTEAKIKSHQLMLRVGMISNHQQGFIHGYHSVSKL